MDSLPHGIRRLRMHHTATDTGRRQWNTCPRSAERWRRRDEVWRLAFLTLGGPVAAQAFLCKTMLGSRQTLFDMAMSSVHGQLQVSHQLHKFATRPEPFFP